MRRIRKLMAAILLAVAFSFAAPQALADDGPVEMPGTHGAVEMPGESGPVEMPGIVGIIIVIIVSTIPGP